jgi:hypothetical protein
MPSTRRSLPPFCWNYSRDGPELNGKKCVLSHVRCAELRNQRSLTWTQHLYEPLKHLDKGLNPGAPELHNVCNDAITVHELDARS